MSTAIYIDGATRKGGHASCAYVVYEDGVEVGSAMKYLGTGVTNNYAEYQGLLLAMKTSGILGCTIYCDSKLVVEQVNGRWKVNNPTLRGLCAEAQGLLARFGYTLVHVKGHDGNKGNERADQLCNECLDSNPIQENQ